MKEAELGSLQEKILGNTNIGELDDLLNRINILKSQSMVNQFLKVGDEAPDFKIEFNKKNFELKKICQKSNLVLIFVRGGWCPYCYIQLREFQKSLEEFNCNNTNLIAISAEKQNYCMSTIKRHGLSYPMLSDNGNKVAKKYKLIYENKINVNLFADLGFDAAIDNGDISYELPVPATFIIDQNQTIRYAHVNPDYKLRPKSGDVLKMIKAMNN